MRYLLQHSIPDQVPMCIVNRLEVIDVEHHEAGGCLGTNSALKLAAKRFEDCAPVPYPGKQIVRRLKKKLLLSLDLAVLQREDAVASLQSGTQLAFVERLGQIVVSPRLQALDQILFAIFLTQLSQVKNLLIGAIRDAVSSILHS